jgi:hypothetical protein
MNESQPTFKLILENKPLNPCVVHDRELLIDLYNQAKSSPTGPWKMEQAETLIKFNCTLCGLSRMYRQTTEKTLL